MTVPNDLELYELAQQVGRDLLNEDKYLCSAESCTGGWLGKVLTDIPGSSRWYERGFITYTNQAKHDLLGVDNDVLEEQGAVSDAVASAMARGALVNSLADIAIAITGIAGPGGGTEIKPVGLVWFGWAWKNKSKSELTIKTESIVFSGDREKVRRQAVGHALLNIIK